MLGVCLGHQALAEVFGATVSHAPELMHGKTSLIAHDGEGVLAGLDEPFTATRYHSLAVERRHRARRARGDGSHRCRCPAASPDGVIMGLQHRELPLHGVQFHPESVLTEGGHRLLANWLEVCGLEGAVAAVGRHAPPGPRRRPLSARKVRHAA